MFFDLRGFTAFAETAEPEEVMAVLREYHAAMGRLILAPRGHARALHRRRHDGLLQRPGAVPDPAERAVRMARRHARARAGARAGLARSAGIDLDFGVGIAQGYATLGAIGFEGRFDYGAIGTVTNLAARLCGEAKAGQILMASRVAGALDGLIEVEEVGKLTLKGFLRPIPTFSLLGLR